MTRKVLGSSLGPEPEIGLMGLKSKAIYGLSTRLGSVLVLFLSGVIKLESSLYHVPDHRPQSDPEE